MRIKRPKGCILTKREFEVLYLRSTGLTGKEVSNLLSITMYSSYNTSCRAYKKLEVHTIIEAIIKCRKLGYF